MPFAVPVVSARLVWSVKCHYAGSSFAIRESAPADGVLKVTDLKDNHPEIRYATFRAEFVSNTSLREEDARPLDEGRIFVGLPYTDLVFYERKSWVQMDYGERRWVWMTDDDDDTAEARFEETSAPDGRTIVTGDFLPIDVQTIGDVYRVHHAVRTVQLAYRRRVAARADAFREAMAENGTLPLDAVEHVISKLGHNSMHA